MLRSASARMTDAANRRKSCNRWQVIFGSPLRDHHSALHRLDAEAALERSLAKPMQVGGTIVALAVIGLTASPAYPAIPQNGPATVKDGVQALQSNDFARAEQIFSQLVQTAPTATNLAYLAVAELSAG